ncbi:hypothetical protein AAG906_022350 [Vitis piasezkii]
MVAIDDDFPDEDVAAVTSISGWCMYFDGVANHSRYGIGVLLIFPHGDHFPRSVRLAFSNRHPATNNILLSPGSERWRCLFVDVLATLASMIDIPVDTIVRPLLIESRFVPACCCLVDEAKFDDGLPWFMRESMDHIWEGILWGIDIIGKISPKSSSGREFILVAIHYFTKWVEATSYARLTSSRVARATPYSLVYGIEAVLPVEIEMGSLRMALHSKSGSNLDRYKEGADPRGCCMVDGSRWKPILRAEQCRSTEEVLCLRPWS